LISRLSWLLPARALMGKVSWSVADQLAAPVIQLALIPYMLRHMGAEQFGLWILSMSFLGAMQFVSLGASAALINEVSHRQHGGRQASVEPLVRCAVAIVFYGSAASLVAAGAATLLMPQAAPQWGVDNLPLHVVLTVLVVAVSEIDNLFACTLRGLERFAVAAKIELAGRAVWAVAVLVIASHDGSAGAVLLITLGLTVVKAALKAWAVQKLLQSGRPVWWPAFSASDAGALLPFGGWALVQSVSGLLFMSADRWLIGLHLGAAPLALYNICLQFAQISHTLLSAALQVIVPLTSRHLGAGNREALVRYGMRGAAGAAVACLLLPAVLAIFAPQILSLWLSPAFSAENTPLARLLLLAFAVLCINIPSYFMLIGLGDIRFTSLLNLLAGSVCATLLVALEPDGLQDFAHIRVLYGVLLLSSWLQLRQRLRALASVSSRA